MTQQHAEQIVQIFKRLVEAKLTGSPSESARAYSDLDALAARTYCGSANVTAAKPARIERGVGRRSANSLPDDMTPYWGRAAPQRRARRVAQLLPHSLPRRRCRDGQSRCVSAPNRDATPNIGEGVGIARGLGLIRFLETAALLARRFYIQTLAERANRHLKAAAAAADQRGRPAWCLSLGGIVLRYRLYKGVSGLQR